MNKNKLKQKEYMAARNNLNGLIIACNFDLFLKMFEWQKLNIITIIIPDLCTLISNVKDSTVCSGFWESISHSRWKPCIVVMGIFYRSDKKTSKFVERKWFWNLYMKTALWKVTASNNLIKFNVLKRGLECSRNLEKVMILMPFFCMTKRGYKVDL